MNEDELIARLRDTLRSMANAVTPSPTGHLPAAAGLGGSRLRHPLAGRPLALAASVAAAAAVAAAVVLGTTGPGHHRTRVAVSGPAPSSTTPAKSSATRPAPSSTAPSATDAAQPLPSDFHPISVTFVSPRTGWVLGSVSCESGWCAAVGVTHDGGMTWQGAPSPPITFRSPANYDLEGTITFADGINGWIVAPSLAAGVNHDVSQLWSTHDGGRQWDRVALPGGARGNIMALAASDRLVHAVIFDLVSDSEKVWTTPASSDSWTASPVALNLGAGPVPQADLVLQGSAGWVVNINRTVVGGARLTSGRWSQWTPPCSTDNGPTLLAASPPSHLVALCDEGVWGSPEQSPPGATFPSEWLYVSTDRGTTFTEGVELPASVKGANAVSTPAPGTVVVASLGDGLVATFDGAKTWQTVYRTGSAAYIPFLGFTTSTQGVAIVQQGQAGSAQSQSAVMLVTRDGGHHWESVHF